LPFLFAVSIAFLSAAAARLTGSLWCLPMWGLSIAGAGLGASFVPAGFGTSGTPWLIRSASLAVIVAALLAVRCRLSNPLADRLFVAFFCVVTLVGLLLTSPFILGALILLLVLESMFPASSGGQYPSWISLGLCIVTLVAAIAASSAEGSMSALQILLLCLSAAFWLNMSFGLRHLLASVPRVYSVGVRRRARSDIERLITAYQNLCSLLRDALARHLGEGFLQGLERSWEERLDAEIEVPETEEIATLAVHLDSKCHTMFSRVQKLLGRHLFPSLISDVLHRIYWMEREVLVQHIPTIAAGLERDQEEAIDPEELLVDLPLFSGLDEGHRKEVASLFRRRRVPEGAQVIGQGEPGSEFYVIAHGTASVEVEDEWGQKRTVAHLAGNDYFGEIALLQDVPRTATVVAQTPLDLFVLGRQDFRTHLTEVSTLAESIEVSVARVNMLRGITLFRRLPPALLTKIASWFELLHAKPGELIIEENQPGEAFYVIQKGLCQVVHRRDEATEEELARLGPGEYFGEISLVLGRPTTATVRALEHTDLLRLPEDRFLAIFRENTFFAESLSKVASRRMVDTTERKRR